MVEYEKKWGAKTEPAGVVMYLEKYRVEGILFRVPNMRVSDAINQATSFIAVKDATVYPLDSDTPLFSKPFLAVHRDQVIFVSEPD